MDSTPRQSPNTRSLVIVSKLSQAYISVILELAHRGLANTVYLTQDGSIFKIMKEMGISPILVSTDIQQTWEDRDRSFRELAMPGALDGIRLPHSEFPIWKSLSLDRMYFWYRGKSQERFLEMLSAIQCDRVYISLDLYDPTTWAASSIAPTTAIQVESLKTREVYDLAANFPFEEIVVWDESTKAALIRWGYTGRITVSLYYPYSETVIDAAQKENLREGLGLSDEEKVRAVIYTSQTERTFRAFVAQGGLNTKTIIITSSRHDTEQVYELCGGPIVQSQTIVTEDKRLIGAADEIICFMYSEEISRTYTLPVKVMDMNLRHLSDEAAK